MNVINEVNDLFEQVVLRKMYIDPHGNCYHPGKYKLAELPKDIRTDEYISRLEDLTVKKVDHVTTTPTDYINKQNESVIPALSTVEYIDKNVSDVVVKTEKPVVINIPVTEIRATEIDVSAVEEKRKGRSK